jgi:hypothetical protein
MRYPIERSRYWVDFRLESQSTTPDLEGGNETLHPIGSLTDSNHDRGVDESATLLITHTGNYADLHS